MGRHDGGGGGATSWRVRLGLFPIWAKLPVAEPASRGRRALAGQVVVRRRRFLLYSGPPPFPPAGLDENSDLRFVLGNVCASHLLVAGVSRLELMASREIL